MIEIDNLSFGYTKKKLLFEDLNLQLSPGHIYGLLGKNGAGKSTLLKLITGLVYPKKGNCLILNHQAKQRLPEVLKRLFYIPEEFQLPAISMKQFISTHAPFYDAFDYELYEKNMREFELPTNDILNKLSFGQKKKFLIAFGIATCTDALFMDEPTNGLDIPSKSQFRRVVAASIDENRCFIISTHQVRDLASLIDHVVILEQGKILFQQNTDAISQKLAFTHTKDELPLPMLYTEKSFGGAAMVALNTKGIETELDLELLFNAIIAVPNEINNAFKA